MNTSKNRIQTPIDGKDINLFRFNNHETNDQVNSLINEYRQIVENIISKKVKKHGQRSEFNENVDNELERIKEIKALLDSNNIETFGRKNIFSKSTNNDEMIGNGQDSLVFNSSNPLYVYKEGKESTPENIEFLKKKYSLLKKYLGDIIPKSAFVYGESVDKINSKGMQQYFKTSFKALTIQKKVKGKDAQKMNKEERINSDFLHKLEKAHKKYVLLKLFVNTITEELGLKRKTLNLQLDLGPISKADNLHIDDIDFVEGKITSPNIMWDGENIYFIDFGFGEWNNDREKIFSEMMKEKNIRKWQKLCSAYGV